MGLHKTLSGQDVGPCNGGTQNRNEKDFTLPHPHPIGGKDTGTINRAGGGWGTLFDRGGGNEKGVFWEAQEKEKKKVVAF